MVLVFNDATAETFPDDAPATSPVFSDVVAHVDDRDVYLEIGGVDRDVPFDEAQDVADEAWLREQAASLYDAWERGEQTDIELANGHSKLRGFGGGLLTVIDDGETYRVAGPRRDFGPISHKGMLDISAGRTMYPAADSSLFPGRRESWMELMVREGDEEIVFMQDSEEYSTVLLPAYENDDITDMAHQALLSEFVGAARIPDSHLHTEQFTTDTYDAAVVAPEDAARITVAVDGHEETFDAGIGFEPETSSIEAAAYKVVDAETLPDDYVLQDTEYFVPGDDYGDGDHFDREVYEIDPATGAVTIYQSGERREETDVAGLVARMDDEFEAFRQDWPDDHPAYGDAPADHYGDAYATVKFRNLVDGDAWPFDTGAAETAPLLAQR